MLRSLKDRLVVFGSGLALLITAYATEVIKDPAIPVLLVQAGFALGWALIAWAALEALLGSAMGGKMRLDRYRQRPRIAFVTRRQINWNVQGAEGLADFVLIVVRAAAGFRHAEGVRIALSLRDSRGHLLGPIPARNADQADYRSDGNENAITIPSGEERSFNVAGRFHADVDAFVANSAAFVLYAARPPHWRLPPGDYAVQADFTCEGHQEKVSFQLVNQPGTPLDLVGSSGPSEVVDISAFVRPGHTPEAHEERTPPSPHVDERQRLIAEISAFLATTSEADWKVEPILARGNARELLGRAILALGDDQGLDVGPADSDEPKERFLEALKLARSLLKGEPLAGKITAVFAQVGAVHRERARIRAWVSLRSSLGREPTLAQLNAEAGRLAQVPDDELDVSEEDIRDYFAAGGRPSPDLVAWNAGAPNPKRETPDDVPEGWSAQFYNGRSVLRCQFDDFRTIFSGALNRHLDTHTEPPQPRLAKEVGRVPRQWARQAIRYLGGIGGPHISSVPADPDHTLYVTEPYADELVATGFYGKGPMENQEHALGPVGRHLVCRCGYEAPTTAEFQGHLRENGIT